MTNQTWFGFFPHLCCVLLGLVAVLGGVLGMDQPDASSGDMAMAFLLGTGAAALGVVGWVYSGREERAPWMSFVAGTSWLLGIAFVLFAAFMVWFTLSLLKGIGDNLGGR